MKSKRFLLGLAPFLIFISILIAVFSTEKPSPVSEEEVVHMIETQFNGSIVQTVTQTDKTYLLIIDHPLGEYEVVVNKDTREIVSLKLLTLYEKDGEREDGTQTMLTERDAIERALQEVNGKVDDVDLEDEDGVLVYKIEIEMNDGDEATVMINAYTGAILSVTVD